MSPLQATWHSEQGDYRFVIPPEGEVSIDNRVVSERPRTLYVTPDISRLDLALRCQEVSLQWECGPRGCLVTLKRKVSISPVWQQQEPRWFESEAGTLLFTPDEIDLTSRSSQKRLARFFWSWMEPVLKHACEGGCSDGSKLLLADVMSAKLAKRWSITRLAVSEDTEDPEKEQSPVYIRAFDVVVDRQRWSLQCSHRCCGWLSSCDMTRTLSDGTETTASMEQAISSDRATSIKLGFTRRNAASNDSISYDGAALTVTDDVWK
jgi:hypothetical protein